MQQHFGPELFDFLADLRANNDREWFQANKGRYEQHVTEPLLRFIEDLKRKDHVATCMFDEDEATAAEGCRKASPYMQFLTTAVGLPY